MLKELHIEVGDVKLFLAALEKLVTVEQTVEKAPSYFGLKIIERNNIPSNKALLIDAEGKLIEVYNIN